jgi:hypothetical protein
MDNQINRDELLKYLEEQYDASFAEYLSLYKENPNGRQAMIALGVALGYADVMGKYKRGDEIWNH